MERVVSSTKRDFKAIGKKGCRARKPKLPFSTTAQRETGEIAPKIIRLNNTRIELGVAGIIRVNRKGIIEKSLYSNGPMRMEPKDVEGRSISDFLSFVCHDKMMDKLDFCLRTKRNQYGIVPVFFNDGSVLDFRSIRITYHKSNLATVTLRQIPPPPDPHN